MIAPVYTIMHIYRAADMALVRVLPSVDDEVNVACFHPLVGFGLVYGTKEGRLRILQHNKAPPPRSSIPRLTYRLDNELLEAEGVAGHSSSEDGGVDEHV